jgi:hypothetical protein
MSSFVERAVAEATGTKLSRVLLTILAAPFYLIGLLVGVVVVVAVVAFGAVKLGVVDVRRHAERTPPIVDGDS